MLTVHLRVNDPAGRPTPVRLRIADSQGRYYAPFGLPTEFPYGRAEAQGPYGLAGTERYSIIDGSCEIALPTEVPLKVEISKGPEFEPIRAEATLGPGQMALRYTLQRIADLPSQSWFSGDTRCHFLSPHDALLMAAAEDLAVVELLACEQSMPGNDGKLYPITANLAAFSGNRPCLERDGCVVAVNTFNTHPVLGRVSLLNCHRAVYPLTSGGEEMDDWSISDWCDQCHRKTGVTVWSDAFRPGPTPATGGGALAAFLLGKIDALEFDAKERVQSFMPSWYRLLEAGFAAPLVGASARDSSRYPLGAIRTYARLEEGKPFSLATWMEALRAGRTFVTNGPLLDFKLNGHAPGTTIELASATKPISIQAAALGSTPIKKLEIVANGKVVAEGSATVETELLLPDGGWVAARCHGGEKPVLYPVLPAFAHTSPVQVLVANRPRRQDATARKILNKQVAAAMEWIESEGRFSSDRARDRLLEGCRQAQAILNQG